MPASSGASDLWHHFSRFLGTCGDHLSSTKAHSESELRIAAGRTQHVPELQTCRIQSRAGTSPSGEVLGTRHQDKSLSWKQRCWGNHSNQLHPLLLCPICDGGWEPCYHWELLRPSSYVEILRSFLNLILIFIKAIHVHYLKSQMVLLYLSPPPKSHSSEATTLNGLSCFFWYWLSYFHGHQLLDSYFLVFKILKYYLLNFYHGS